MQSDRRRCSRGTSGVIPNHNQSEQVILEFPLAYRPQTSSLPAFDVRDGFSRLRNHTTPNKGNSSAMVSWVQKQPIEYPSLHNPQLSPASTLASGGCSNVVRAAHLLQGFQLVERAHVEEMLLYIGPFTSYV